MPMEYRRVAPAPVPAEADQNMVRMRDGVHLATDIYHPAGADGPGPTVLTRLPYDKVGEYTFIPTIAAYFSQRGYRFVAQDVRGKFRSEGETISWVNEAYDGHDTLAWIAAQTWSDGIVGMWGDSYYGYTQLAAASTGHPALRAMVPRFTGTGLGSIPIRRAGARTARPEMGINRIYHLTFMQSNDSFEWEPEWTRPYAEIAERWFDTVGERSASYDLTMPHPVELRRFPAGHPFDAPPVPTLQTIGWWDNCAIWQWPDHEAIAERPAWAACEYLLIEASDHENYQFIGRGYREEEDPVLNPGALERMLPRYLDPAIEFFDVFLRGRGTPVDIPKVRWTLTGDPGLKASPSWPPPDAEPLELHLGGGSLSSEPPEGAQTSTWTHDPEEPVPSPAADSFAFLQEYPDEAYLAGRPDVLAFSAEPRSAPLVLAGPISFEATVCSSGPEADFFIRLTDVAPDGSAHLVARGEATLFEATDPFRVRVPMGHAGYRLRAGHALRLTIASSDAPEFIVSPGTGEHRWLAVETCRTEQEIRLGGDEGATLSLTVLPTPEDR